jgi:NAD(P)H-flavin reductase
VSFPSHLGYREELERPALETLSDPGRKLSLLYFPTTGRTFMDPSWTGFKGRAETLLPSSLLRKPGPPNLEDTVRSMLKVILRPETHTVCVCGHPGTVDNVADTLSRRGFRPDADIKRERYYP